MHLVHIASPSIVLLLTERLDIQAVWRVRRSYRPPPCVIRVNELASTPDGSPRFDQGTFETDALGCIRLLWWIVGRHTAASAKVHFDRFNALFGDNPTDALKTALRILWGIDATASGEHAYFCAQQWRNHPTEMGAMALLGTLL